MEEIQYKNILQSVFSQKIKSERVFFIVRGNLAFVLYD